MLDGHVLLDVVVNVLAEGRLCVAQRDTVLWTFGSGDRRHHVGQVQLDVLGELRLTGGVVPHALFLGVGLDQRELLVAAAGHPQVVDGDLVDRENRCGGTEFGAHVAQRGAVGQGYLGHALTVELDELADHAVLAQHLGGREHDVGGGHADRAFAGQLEPDHPRDQHRHRLAEHGGFSLDAADAPAQHPEAVLHRGVRVGANAGVRVGDPIALHHHAGQVLDVDLVHDAGARRHHLEVVEGALTPAQELVALAVALVFDLDVALERVRCSEEVGDHRVVDDQVGRRQRIDLVGVAAQLADGLAHGGQVDDAGHPGEVLHDHPGGGELDLHARVGRGIPVRDGLDVVLGDVGAVFGAQQILGEHLEAVRQFLGAGHRVEAVDLVAVVPDLEGVSGSKRIDRIFAAHINSRLVLAATGCVGGARNSNSTLVLHNAKGLDSVLSLKARAASGPSTHHVPCSS